MSSSPDPRARVLRAAEARAAAPARFDVPLAGVGGRAPADRDAARALGYAAGWADGQRRARLAADTETSRLAADAAAVAADRGRHADRALRALAAAATDLERRAAPTVAESRDALLSAALELARTLLGRELALSASPGEDALRRALALAPENRPVTVRLHPADLAALGVAGGGVIEVDGRPVELRPDPALEPGDAIAECDATVVDARLSAALERVRAVIGA